MAQTEPIRRVGNSEIPDKLYFRIGDVAKLCEVPAYVLRFWESEFPLLKPNKGGTGQRLYRRRDVEMALRIKHLLYDEGYTIPGARQVFKSEQGTTKEPQLALAIDPVAGQPGGDARRVQGLKRLRKELQDLHQLLSGQPAAAKSSAVQTIRAARAPRTTHHLSLAPSPRPSPMDDLFDLGPALSNGPEAPSLD